METPFPDSFELFLDCLNLVVHLLDGYPWREPPNVSSVSFGFQKVPGARYSPEKGRSTYDRVVVENAEAELDRQRNSKKHPRRRFPKITVMLNIFLDLQLAPEQQSGESIE